MQRLILGFGGAAAMLIAADAASAADIYKARPAPKSDPCGVARFSGAYFGGNTGAVAYTSVRTDADEYFPVEGNYSATRIGITGGVQAGYDWQSCNRVFGIVADFNLANADAITRDSANLMNTIRTIESGMDWFSTLRARAGLAVNDTLFYVTGGLAVARIDTTITTIESSSNRKYAFSDTRLGLTGGVGAEFMLRDNWSVNVEALYMQFAKKDNTFRQSNDNYIFVANDSAWVTRVGLNYRFDNPRNAYASANAGSVAPVYPCGPARFNGGYVGGNAGAVSYSAVRQDRDGALEILGDLSATTTGFTAGAQAGWDWQSCNRLLGIVADWNWSGADATARNEPHSQYDRTMQGSLHWFSTLRGRAGLVVDDALIYVTGGAAAARIGSITTNRGGSFNSQNSFSDTRWGLAAGVGAEFAISGQWSVSTELLYLQFAKDIDTFRDGNATRSVENRDSAWVSRIGLNYRWDNPHNAYAAARAPARSCDSSRFSGGYVGGNVGAIHRTALSRDTDSFFFDRAQHTATEASVAGGVQAGYDWQSCGKLFGVVADLNFTNADTLARIYPNGGNGGDWQSHIRSDMKWFSTLRSRAGLVMNDTLVYVTGGVALAGLGVDLSNGEASATHSSSSTRWGWTGGAGAEVALAGNWSVNGEVLYMQFARETDTFRYGNLRTLEYYDSAWIGRVGVNYRVAKY
jgi:opacity protein-like surface antigen